MDRKPNAQRLADGNHGLRGRKRRSHAQLLGNGRKLSSCGGAARHDHEHAQCGRCSECGECHDCLRSGGSTGTFTIATSAPDAAFEAENGLATTAGTIFDFDPGALVVGTTTARSMDQEQAATWYSTLRPVNRSRRIQGTIGFITAMAYGPSRHRP